MTAAAAPLRWQDVGEKGSTLGIRVLVAIATGLGRRAGRLALHVIAAWFVLFHRSVRRTSRAYLRRVGEPSGLGAVYRHVLRFAQVSLDRVFMAKGDFRPFRIAFHGEEHLRAAAATGNGALVVVAHLGSFDVLQALAGERALPVRFLADFRNAPAFNAALRALNPRVDARVIPIRPGDPGFVLEAEEVVRAGHLLGTMGDRVGSDARAVVVPFLGAPARFPAGPWLVAAALGCPVLLAFGLHTPPDRYDLHCEPFAERIALPRRGRDEAVAAWAARYAQRLEAYVRRAPYDWFNFYDFWSTT